MSFNDFHISYLCYLFYQEFPDRPTTNPKHIRFSHTSRLKPGNFRFLFASQQNSLPTPLTLPLSRLVVMTETVAVSVRGLRDSQGPHVVFNHLQWSHQAHAGPINTFQGFLRP